MPDVCSPFGVPVGAFLFDPHGGGQDQVRTHRRHRRIGIGDDDEILGITIALIGLVAVVRPRLHVVVDLDPVETQLAVLQHPVLLDGMIAGLFRNDPVGNPPDLLGMLAVLGLVTAMSAGRRWAKVPTSRAVPQAEGWPVSENGLFPGSEIFPVSRWIL